MRKIRVSILMLVLFNSCNQKTNDNRPVHTHQVKEVMKADSVIMLNDSQIRLANITVRKVTIEQIGQTSAINARIKTDEELSETISSRSEGRIEKLFIKETGRSVRKGEALYELYSEKLLTLQREYLLAKEQYESVEKKETRFLTYLQSAKKKLLLYGLTEKQIEQLANSKPLQQTITFLSPANGIVTEINAAEGQYVDEGSLLYKIDNLDQLWIEADLYPEEEKLIAINDLIKVRIGGSETSSIEIKVTFVSPEYKANSQITVIRAALKNPEGKWKPGMQAQVILNHSSQKAIAIPVDAVVRSENKSYVFVLSDKNTFQSRLVKTGIENFEQVEITSGLIEGESIAVSGAYLLYSEFILKKGSI